MLGRAAGPVPHAMWRAVCEAALRPALRQAPGVWVPVPQHLWRALPAASVLHQPRADDHHRESAQDWICTLCRPAAETPRGCATAAACRRFCALPPPRLQVFDPIMFKECSITQLSDEEVEQDPLICLPCGHATPVSSRWHAPAAISHLLQQPSPGWVRPKAPWSFTCRRCLLWTATWS